MGVWPGRMSVARCVEDRALRDGRIHDNDVRLQGLRLGDHLDAIACFTHNLKAGTFAEQFTKSGSHHYVIVGDQNPETLQTAAGRVVGHEAFPPAGELWRTTGRQVPQITPRYGQGEARSLAR